MGHSADYIEDHVVDEEEGPGANGHDAEEEEEADDPCFDDRQVGGEDGEPRHGRRRGRVLGSW